MELTDQVTNRELSERLRDLGFPQESLFWWSQGKHDQRDKEKWELHDCIDTHARANASAYTVAELGELLPAYIIAMAGTESEMRFDLNEWKDAGWHVGYWWDEDTRRKSGMTIENKVEAKHADARGEMLAYLKEQKLI